MAREVEVARALRLIGENEFDIFDSVDHRGLLELVEDYFCGDDPQEVSSGKLHLS